MQINIQIDDNEPTHEFLSKITIQSLQISRECLMINKSKNPEDKKLVKALLKAHNLILWYYDGVQYD